MAESGGQGRSASSRGGGDDEEEEDPAAGGVAAAVPSGLTPKQQKLFELRLKLNESRKANQVAVVEEKKRKEAPEDYKNMAKKKQQDNATKRREEVAVAKGVDPTKKHLLQTAEQAEAMYKKNEKKETPFGWDVFNQKSLYNAYVKRTKNIQTTKEEYEAAKVAQSDFYREHDSLEYGKSNAVPEENIDRMVQEIEDRKQKRTQFSRRRKYYEERDIDSINDRNLVYNKKVERAFGDVTREIKANLERGTALPEH